MSDFDKNRFASKSIEYETPWSIYNPIAREFGVTLDVCANEKNRKHKNFYSPQQDGLKQNWEGVCWCNPPYGRQLPLWVKKAYDCACQGKATTIMLIPARTNTRWWHDYCMKGEIRFILGRPKFNNGKHGLPFPLALVIFRKK